MRGNRFANSWHQLGTDFLVWWLGGGAYEHWLLCGSQARGSQSEERGLLQTAGELSSCVRVHLCSSPLWTTPGFGVVLASATPLNLCNLVCHRLHRGRCYNRLKGRKKNLLISLVLVLTSSPLPALTWTFCLSSDTYRSGEYCSESLHPRRWCNWYRAVAMSLHVQWPMLREYDVSFKNNTHL